MRLLFLLLLLGMMEGVLAQQNRIKNIFYNSTKQLAQVFCHAHNPLSMSMTESQKQESFLGEPNTAVAIMFWEFIDGKGPEWRYLHEGMPYVQQFKESPGWKVMSHRLHMQEGIEPGQIVHLRYQFSPNLIPCRPSTWIFAVVQNIKALKSSHLEQFFLGSFDLWAEADSMGGWKCTVYNRTSRRSLYFGMVPRVERPRRLGTIRQVIIFYLSAEESKNTNQ